MKVENKTNYISTQSKVYEKPVTPKESNLALLPKTNDFDDKKTVSFNAVYLNNICNLSFKRNSDDKQRGLEELNKKYALKFLQISEKYQNAGQEVLGIKVLELISKFQKEEIAYAEKHSIDYIENQQASLEDLKTAAAGLDDMLKFRKKYLEENKEISDEALDKISFCGEIKRLTEDQKGQCHVTIHTSSLMCAGVTAAVGEFCAKGADIPFLVGIETKMFQSLAEILDADKKAALLHGGKHMFSAGMIGASIIKTAASWLTIVGHPIVAAATGGAGNIPLSAGLRIANGGLSAAMCESMGWAFVGDYEKGKMNVKQKGKELVASLTFAILFYGFESKLDLEKPAELLKGKAAEALGNSIFQNMPSGVGYFIEEATKFVQSNAISYAAKGLELITPAIASNVIENGGKFDSKSAEQIVKGSIFSLICGDLLGSETNLDETLITEKSKKIIGFLSNDPQIQKLINNELVRRGIRQSGEIVLNKGTVKSLESLYNELTPKLTEIVKTIRGL